MPCLTPVATHTGKLKRLCLHKYRATVDSRVRVAAAVVIDTTVGHGKGGRGHRWVVMGSQKMQEADN